MDANIQRSVTDSLDHSHHMQQARQRPVHEHNAGSGRGGHDDPGPGLSRLAASATLHCLTGCAIGEILGLILGTALGLSAVLSIGLAITLAFLFGYALSTLPLLKAGLGLGRALGVVLAADTLSIAVMELVDNTVMAVVPGAMSAGLANPVFWVTLTAALAIAYAAAYPVNRYLLARGKGHARAHEHHHAPTSVSGWRARIPSFSTTALAAAVLAFMAGGFTVAAFGGMVG